MITTYGEDSAKQIFDMGAVYYYLIDNSTYVEAPETEAETTEAENILEEKGDCCRGERGQFRSKLIRRS